MKLIPAIGLISCLLIGVTLNQQDPKELFEALDSLSIKTVHLTFDDGPNAIYTPQILDLLKQNNLKANFFLVGENVKRYPGLVKRIVSEGHDIGGHSMTHKQLTKIPLDAARAEILDSMALVNQYETSKLFRFPYGAFNAKLVEIVREAGYRNIFWSVDTTDWKYHDKDVIFSKFRIRLSRARDGSIVLMHDTHPQTVETLKLVIRYLKEHGIKVTKIL